MRKRTLGNGLVLAVLLAARTAAAQQIAPPEPAQLSPQENVVSIKSADNHSGEVYYDSTGDGYYGGDVQHDGVVADGCVSGDGYVGDGDGEAGGVTYGRNPGLFRNYYVGPGPYGYAAAQLYLSPIPTPPLVGHTYITYPPFMPHHYLWTHGRTYRAPNRGGGFTVTRVRWGWSPRQLDYSAYQPEPTPFYRTGF